MSITTYLVLLASFHVVALWFVAAQLVRLNKLVETLIGRLPRDE